MIKTTDYVKLSWISDPALSVPLAITLCLDFPTSGSPGVPQGAERFTGTPREGEAGYKAQAFSDTGGDVKIILLILCKLCYVSEPQSPSLGC